MIHLAIPRPDRPEPPQPVHPYTQAVEALRLVMAAESRRPTAPRIGDIYTGGPWNGGGQHLRMVIAVGNAGLAVALLSFNAAGKPCAAIQTSSAAIAAMHYVGRVTNLPPALQVEWAG